MKELATEFVTRLDCLWFRFSRWLQSHRLGGLVVAVETVRALPEMPASEWPAFLKGEIEEGGPE